MKPDDIYVLTFLVIFVTCVGMTWYLITHPWTYRKIKTAEEGRSYIENLLGGGDMGWFLFKSNLKYVTTYRMEQMMNKLERAITETKKLDDNGVNINLYGRYSAPPPPDCCGGDWYCRVYLCGGKERERERVWESEDIQENVLEFLNKKLNELKTIHEKETSTASKCANIKSTIIT